MFSAPDAPVAFAIHRMYQANSFHRWRTAYTKNVIGTLRSDEAGRRGRRPLPCTFIKIEKEQKRVWLLLLLFGERQEKYVPILSNQRNSVKTPSVPGVFCHGRPSAPCACFRDPFAFAVGRRSSDRACPTGGKTARRTHPPLSFCNRKAAVRPFRTALFTRRAFYTQCFYTRAVLHAVHQHKQDETVGVVPAVAVNGFRPGVRYGEGRAVKGIGDAADRAGRLLHPRKRGKAEQSFA